MSDMSFKQAKELVERLELSELTIKKSTKDLENSSKQLEEALREQEHIAKLLPYYDKKLNFLRLLIAVNVGFIVGLLVGAILIK